MRIEPLRDYAFEELGLDEDALDGPLLLGDGRFALLISLRGTHGGRMPSPSEIHWSRDLPPAAKGARIHALLRRGDRVLALGEATVARKGQLARDGFKVALALAEPLEDARWRELVADAERPPAPAPEELIAALRPKCTTGERLAALRAFAVRWFGCEPDAPPLATIAPVPEPLRVLHDLAGDRTICAQNRLVGARELVADDGKVIFYVENQGVCVWATEAAGDDPPVYVRSESASAPWTLESETLSSFLIELAILEAVFGAPFGASHDGLDASDLARLARRVRPLALPPWQTSKTRFFGSGGVVGFAIEDGEASSVWIGAKDRVRLEPLEDLVADWSHVSF